MLGNADSFMGVGWSACQPKFCWTNANRVSVRIPVKAVSSDLVLHARFRPFVDKIKVPQQRIRVSVNGTQLEEWLFTARKTYRSKVRIPADLLAGDELLIVFDLPDAVIPESVGLGGDRRLLGIAMYALRIEMLDDAGVPDNRN